MKTSMSSGTTACTVRIYTMLNYDPLSSLAFSPSSRPRQLLGVTVAACRPLRSSGARLRRLSPRPHPRHHHHRAGDGVGSRGSPATASPPPPRPSTVRSRSSLTRDGVGLGRQHGVCLWSQRNHRGIQHIPNQPQRCRQRRPPPLPYFNGYKINIYHNQTNPHPI